MKDLLLSILQYMFKYIIIIHEFHGDTSLKQNFRAAFILYNWDAS